MHRHSYHGRKLHRERDQRKALLAGLACQLIEHGKIETTRAKAQEVRPMLEKLITKAKRYDLHSRRQIIAALPELSIAHKLVDEIAPKLKHRSSGYLKIETSRYRKGDNAEMVTIAFVDDLKDKAPIKETE